MKTLEQLIEAMPDELQPLARQYATETIGGLQARISRVVELLLDERAGGAFGAVVEGLATAEIIALQRTINDRMAQIAADRAEQARIRKTFVLQVLNLAVETALIKAAGPSLTGASPSPN